MKQRITIEQLRELTPEQQERLREWWRPLPGDIVVALHICADDEIVIGDGWDMDGGVIRDTMFDPDGEHIHFSDCLPLLSIGQCMDFISEKEDINEIYKGVDPYDSKVKLWTIIPEGHAAFINFEMIDALWEAVKEVL